MRHKKYLTMFLSFIFSFVSLYPINAMENIKDESNTSKDDKSKYSDAMPSRMGQAECSTDEDPDGWHRQPSDRCRRAARWDKTHSFHCDRPYSGYACPCSRANSDFGAWSPCRTARQYHNSVRAVPSTTWPPEFRME